MSTVPLQQIDLPILHEKKVSLFLLREDQRHPFISGNKWWKLKFNLEEAHKLGHEQLLTFGGAYSNHIYALAAAGKEFGFKTIGVIRGEPHFPLNPTLTFAASQGMEFHYVDRQLFKNKQDEDFIQDLQNRFGDFYLIPEGGTNTLAVKGCVAMVSNLPQYDAIACSCGTGGTLAGIIAGTRETTSVLGFSALKNGDQFLYEEIDRLTDSYLQKKYDNYKIIPDYHFGGYAKANAELVNFINTFYTETDIRLDPVYTGKMLYGLLDLVKKEYFEGNHRILAIHTGGLQGITGFNERFKNKNLHILGA